MTESLCLIWLPVVAGGTLAFSLALSEPRAPAQATIYTYKLKDGEVKKEKMFFEKK